MIKLFLSFVILCGIAPRVEGSIPCSLTNYGENKVCVCNTTYCDTIDRVISVKEDEFEVFISSKEGLRFNKTSGRFSKNKKNSNQYWTSSFSGYKPPTFIVDTSQKYQKIKGFGGAFTDAAGINILSLGKETQEHLLRSYFSENGIEYNLCRVPIGGTDFSTHTYSYDDGLADPLLKNFTLAKEDLKYKIPLMQRAEEMSLKQIHYVAASWSPPPWMKSNNDYSGFAYLKDEYYDLYAKYLLRFLDEYQNNNIQIWAISTGNEPSNGLLPFKHFNSMGWTPLTIANWIANFFGPQLRNSSHSDTLILAFDDQRLFLPWWIDLMVKADKNVLNYIDGIAVHWYWDFIIGVGVINKLHDKYPEQFVLYTEACLGDKPWEKKVELGSWERGEKYIADIIENMNAWVTGWMDWNLALDLSGGPTWAKNFVDSPILVNASANEFYKQPMFYAMGHVTKFIERDAVRIKTSPKISSGVHATAVQNPLGRVVMVLFNENNARVEVSLNLSEKGWINLDLPSHSFATVLVDL